MPEPPEALIHFLGMVFSTTNLLGFGLFQAKLISHLIATCAMLLGSS